MNNLIQWTGAKYWTAQWNPIIGCRKCSPACEHCYAAAWAKRFGQSFEPHQSSQARPPRKGVVFCGNMTDLFGEWMFPWVIPQKDSYIIEYPADLIAKCDSCDATYLWLTKRVEYMAFELADGAYDAFPPASYEKNVHYLKLRDLILSNHYFGFTAENQEWYDKRAISCRDLSKWANLWISAEPLLGPLAIGSLLNNLKWVVVGAESGKDRRPCEIKWVEDLVRQCMSAKIPVFVKQLSINGACITDISKFPAHLRIRQVPWTQKGDAK